MSRFAGVFQFALDSVNVRLSNSQFRQHRVISKFVIALRMIRRNVSFIAPEEMHVVPYSNLDLLFQSLVISQDFEHLLWGRAAGERDRKLYLNRNATDHPHLEESRSKMRQLICVGENSDCRFHPHLGSGSFYFGNGVDSTRSAA